MLMLYLRNIDVFVWYLRLRSSHNLVENEQTPTLKMAEKTEREREKNWKSNLITYATNDLLLISNTKYV